MRWLTSKAKEAREAAQAFHDRALQAERERDIAQVRLDKAKRDWQDEHAWRARIQDERDEARANNEALRDQLQAVTAVKDTLRKEKDKACADRDEARHQRDEARHSRNEVQRQLQDVQAGLDAARRYNREILERLQALTAERDTAREEYDRAQALQGQLDHAEALKKFHHMRKRQAEQQMEAAERNNQALREQVEEMLDDMALVKEIADKYQQENE